MIELNNGLELDSIKLPISCTDPKKIVVLKKHFLVSGSYTKSSTHKQNKDWIAIIDKSNFSLIKIIDFNHNYDRFESSGILMGDEVALFSGFKDGIEEVYYLKPEVGVLWESSEARYKLGRSNPRIKKTIPNKTKIFGNYLFYKSNRSTFYGKNLKTGKDLFTQQVKENEFKEFIIIVVHGRLHFFTVGRGYLAAYELRGTQLYKKWHLEHEHLTEKTKLSYDAEHQKIWGLRKNFFDHKVFQWSLHHKKLEFYDKIYLNGEFDLPYFNKHGTPILVRSN